MRKSSPPLQRSALFLLAVIALFTQACSKKVVPALPLPPRTLDIEEIDFGYLHGKAHLNLKTEKKQSDVVAHIRIRKDSVIWMTFSVVGVQGGKALINKDSITIVSQVDKEYFVFDYQELSRRFNFNVDYHVLQSAMLGNLILPRGKDDVIVDEEGYDLLRQHLHTVLIKNYINKSTKKLERLELSESESGNSIRVDYSNFQPLGNKSFPYTGVISVQYKTATGVVNTSITFEYNKAEVGDKELRFPFKLPKRYERR